MKVGLLGFAQSGKKSFFSLLTGRRQNAPGLSAPKEGETPEGIAVIHDPRVDVIADICKPERKKYAENIIALCPDIDPKDAKRLWLESARKCDLLCILVRSFSSAEVYHPMGDVNPERDRSSLESEFIIADLEIIEKRLDRIEKEKKGKQSAQQLQEEKCLVRIKEMIEKNERIDPSAFGKQDLDSIKSLGLLALKPAIWAYNVDENRLGEKRANGENQPFLISCRIEEEIMALENREERALYLKDLGVASSGVDRLNQAAYDALGLMSFYTMGEDEVRAWTIRKGTAAPEAAGKIHSDIERGFIRVEVIKFDDLVKAGSESAAKAQGKAQLKGRDYVLQDGDICHFRFNV